MRAIARWRAPKSTCIPIFLTSHERRNKAHQHVEQLLVQMEEGKEHDSQS
jgi:hypothetical protein